MERHKKWFFAGFFIAFLFNLGLIVYGMEYRFTDFPAFYYAAKAILDPTLPNAAVYSQEIKNVILTQKGLQATGDSFVYSVPAAYVLAPLGLLPYVAAKTVFSLISLVLYIIGVVIVVRYLAGVSGNHLVGILMLALLWAPFIDNQTWNQTNGIIFFILVVAVWLAVVNRPYLGGAVFAVACLFKLFPIIVALALGVKNWRIPAACVAVLGASFLIPGSVEWFTALDSNLHRLYSVFYKLGLVWYGIIVAAAGSLTFWLIYRYRNADHALIASLALFLFPVVLPINETHQMTLLVFGIAYFLALEPPRWFSGLLVGAFILMTAYYLALTPNVSIDVFTVGVAAIWSFVVFYLLRQKPLMLRREPSKAPSV